MNMKKIIIYCCVAGFLFLSFSVTAQNVAINTDGSAADASAMLDVKSINKDMLVPRMNTVQRTGITSPAAGLMVYDTDTNNFWFYNGVEWTQITTGGSSGNQWTTTSNNISNNNSGNVGIGTVSPSDKLHVFGGNATLENNLSNYPWLSFRNNNSLKGYIGANNNDLRIGTWPGSNTTGHIALVTNNTDRLRVMSDGDVGIATSTPRGLFDIGGGNEGVYLASNTTTGNQRVAYMPGNILMSPWNGSNTSYLDIRRTDNIGSIGLQIRTSENGISRDALYLQPNGLRLAIGNNNIPRAGLDVPLHILIRSNNTPYGHFISSEPSAPGFPDPPQLIFSSYELATNIATPRAMISVAGNYIVLSDRQLKKEIEQVNAVLPLIKRLKPSTYYYNNDVANKRKQIGFIAQEVKEIFPELVDVVNNKEGKQLLGINYSNFSVVAIKAIQEQQEEIEKLKSELAEIKKLLTISGKVNDRLETKL